MPKISTSRTRVGTQGYAYRRLRQGGARLRAGAARELSPLSQLLLAAAIPVLGYMSAYLYERGFAIALGMPTEFIVVTMATVSKAWVQMAMALALFVWACRVLLAGRALDQDTRESRAHRWLARCEYAAIVAGAYWVFLLSAAWNTPLMGIWVAAAVLGSALLFLADLLARVTVPPLRSRSTASPELLALRIELAVVWPVLATIAVAILLIFSGASAAYQQVEFTIVPGSPDLVVLGTYGDTLVCATFDRTTREVGPTYAVLTVPADWSLTLRREEIGPLRPVDLRLAPLPSPLATPTPDSSPASTAPEPTSTTPP